MTAEIATIQDILDSVAENPELIDEWIAHKSNR